MTATTYADNAIPNFISIALSINRPFKTVVIDVGARLSFITYRTYKALKMDESRLKLIDLTIQAFYDLEISIGRTTVLDAALKPNSVPIKCCIAEVQCAHVIISSDVGSLM